jgi:hypothetical protein
MRRKRFVDPWSSSFCWLLIGVTPGFRKSRCGGSRSGRDGSGSAVGIVKPLKESDVNNDPPPINIEFYLGF